MQQLHLYEQPRFSEHPIVEEHGDAVHVGNVGNARLDCWYCPQWSGLVGNEAILLVSGFSLGDHKVGLIRNIVTTPHAFPETQYKLLVSGLYAAYHHGVAKRGFVGVRFLNDGDHEDERDRRRRFRYDVGSTPDSAYELGRVYAAIDVKLLPETRLFEIQYVHPDGTPRLVRVPTGSFQIEASMTPEQPSFVSLPRDNRRQIMLEG